MEDRVVEKETTDDEAAEKEQEASKEEEGKEALMELLLQRLSRDCSSARKSTTTPRKVSNPSLLRETV